MPVPTYAGLALFGPFATCNVAGEPRARQMNDYPGVDGVECLDQGSRGAVAVVAGLWSFNSGAELLATLATWRALVDGVGRVLVDSKGEAWPDALLETYQLDGPSVTSPATGQVIQRFAGRLTLLTWS